MRGPQFQAGRGAIYRMSPPLSQQVPAGPWPGHVPKALSLVSPFLICKKCCLIQGVLVGNKAPRGLQSAWTLGKGSVNKWVFGSYSRLGQPHSHLKGQDGPSGLTWTVRGGREESGRQWVEIDPLPSWDSRGMRCNEGPILRPNI